MDIVKLIEAAQQLAATPETVAQYPAITHALNAAGGEFYYHPTESGANPTALDLAKLTVDRLAQEIYAGWADQPGYKPWVIGGNSDKQDEARREAAGRALGK